MPGAALVAPQRLLRRAEVWVVKSNKVEPANRAQVTALLIGAGYRSEPSVDGKDLILRTPAGRLESEGDACVTIAAPDEMSLA